MGGLVIGYNVITVIRVIPYYLTPLNEAVPEPVGALDKNAVPLLPLTQLLYFAFITGRYCMVCSRGRKKACCQVEAAIRRNWTNFHAGP
jgi:hypothetical protein